MLSIAAKAGKVASGGFSTEKTIQEGKAYLVIVAQDSSNNTKKKFTDKCTFYNVPLILYGDSKILGGAIGKQTRMCLAITDERLAKEVAVKLDGFKEVEA